MRLRRRKWILPYLNVETEYQIDNALQIEAHPLYVEIGMGMGDFICESSLLNPEILYIGLEKDPTCVAKTIQKIKEKEISNLLLLHANANEITNLFKPKQIDRIYLHFSDPWPKKGHHKRRLTYPTFLKTYYDLLNDDGLLIFKTDNELLFNDTLEYIEQSQFKIIERNDNYHSVKRDEPLTGYERKFKDLGNPIYYLKLAKK